MDSALKYDNSEVFNKSYLNFKKKNIDVECNFPFLIVLIKWYGISG